MLSRCGSAVFVIFLTLLLGACASPPQTRALLRSPPDIPAQHEINNVPFYAQEQYFCGPTALAEVFSFYGDPVSPENIAPDVFVPQLKGSLQIEMHSAVRKHGFLPYSEKGNLAQLLALVSDGIPVVVLQNLSISWMPRWHYAVVHGYDLAREEVVLHSGTMRSYRMGLSVFERTWARGDYWFLAVVPPTRTSTYFHAYKFVQAAQDMISVGQIMAGQSALQAATEQWPSYWLAYFLLGNSLMKTQSKEAALWFKAGFNYGKEHAVYLNNYAHVLNSLECSQEAAVLSKQALVLAPGEAIVTNTHTNIVDNIKATCGKERYACAEFITNDIASQKSSEWCQ